LYKSGCFVLEAKQGSDYAASATDFRPRRGTAMRETPAWDEAMLAARNQAERYAKAVPEDGWPPFLVIVDVGFSIELYADFSLTGKNYAQFPDRNTFRILLTELSTSTVQERLRAVWLDPLSLDPTRISARVTRGVAEKLAELARDLEETHDPARVAGFLMRCIFTSFAEDVHLLPPDSWTDLLEDLGAHIDDFCPTVESLWTSMNSGGFSPILRQHVLHFNGGLFETVEALPVNAPSLNCSSAPPARTGETSNHPYSALCSNARLTKTSGTALARPTGLASTSSGSSSPRSFSPSGTIGNPFKQPRSSFLDETATVMRLSRFSVISGELCATCACSTRPVVAATSYTLRSNT